VAYAPVEVLKVVLWISGATLTGFVVGDGLNTALTQRSSPCVKTRLFGRPHESLSGTVSLVCGDPSPAKEPSRAIVRVTPG
jgi:hypothetical protein